MQAINTFVVILIYILSFGGIRCTLTQQLDRVFCYSNLAYAVDTLFTNNNTYTYPAPGPNNRNRWPGSCSTSSVGGWRRHRNILQPGQCEWCWWVSKARWCERRGSCAEMRTHPLRTLVEGYTSGSSTHPGAPSLRVARSWLLQRCHPPQHPLQTSKLLKIIISTVIAVY